MLRILDRYLVREIALPFALGLTVLTFILVLPPILVAGEEFISKGVEWSIVARAMATLLPQALSLTIPMAVLLHGARPCLPAKLLPIAALWASKSRVWRMRPRHWCRCSARTSEPV